jgi:hypothetical protein
VSFAVAFLALYVKAKFVNIIIVTDVWNYGQIKKKLFRGASLILRQKKVNYH